MNNGQMTRGNENTTQHLPWWLRRTTKKNPARLVGTGIRTRDLPNASLVRYHGATSLGDLVLYQFEAYINTRVCGAWARICKTIRRKQIQCGADNIKGTIIRNYREDS